MAPKYASQMYPRSNEVYLGKGGNGHKVFTPEKRAEYIEEFMKTGSIYKAAAAIGIDPQLVFEWRKKNDDFRELFERAREALVDVLEGEAYRRAVIGIKKGIYYQGELVAKERVFSDKMLVTLLRANAPDKYRYRDSIEEEDPFLGANVNVTINAVPSGQMFAADKVIDGTVAQPEVARDASIFGADISDQRDAPQEPNPGKAASAAQSAED